MIIYYSLTKTTAQFAQALSEIKGVPAFRLTETKAPPMLLAVIKSVLHIGQKPEEMPDISNEKEVTLCWPVWVGGMPSVARYFIKKAGLGGKTVNVLLTCGYNNEAYMDTARKAVASSGCAVGWVKMFEVKPAEPKPSVEAAKRRLLDAGVK